MEKDQIFNTSEYNKKNQVLTAAGKDITPVWITNKHGVTSCKTMDLYKALYSKNPDFRLATVREVEMEVPAEGDEGVEKEKQVDSLSMSELRKRAKDLEINSYGKTKDALREEIKSAIV